MERANQIRAGRKSDRKCQNFILLFRKHRSLKNLLKNSTLEIESLQQKCSQISKFFKEICLKMSKTIEIQNLKKR